MTALITDERLAGRLIAERQKLGLDRWDEVWDGVYVMSPPPNIEHQKVVDRLTAVLTACRSHKTDTVVSGVGVSPLADGWEKNYRVPDISVVLTGNPLVDHGTHYQGGPDLVVEVRSPGDHSLNKFDLYARLRVREVLIVGRDTRVPSLYRLSTKMGRYRTVLPASRVLPAEFTVGGTATKPNLLVRRTAGAARTWRV